MRAACLFALGLVTAGLFGAADAADFTWTGAAGSILWYDTLLIDSGPTYISNWGTTGNPPSFPGASDDVFVTGGPYQAETDDPAAINNLAIGSGCTVYAYDTSTLAINGPTITTEGDLYVEGGGITAGTLQIDVNTEISGAGDVVLDNGHLSGTGTLSNATGHTIRTGGDGPVQRGYIEVELINDGTIETDKST